LDFDIEDDHTFSEETEIHEGETPVPPGAEKVKGQTLAGAPPAKAPPSEAPTQKTMNIYDVPVNVIVEVAQIEVSIQKLAELQPGSVLELNVHPEDGVNLTINGQLVAKGELV